MLQIEAKECFLVMGQALLSCYDVFGLEMQTLEDSVPELGPSYCLSEHFFFRSNATETSESVYCSM